MLLTRDRLEVGMTFVLFLRSSTDPGLYINGEIESLPHSQLMITLWTVVKQGQWLGDITTISGVKLRMH